MTKTKWYFAIPLLCMLIVYQFLNTGEYTDEKEKAKVATYRVNISRAIKLFTVIGFLHYTYRQYIEQHSLVDLNNQKYLVQSYLEQQFCHN